MTCRLFGPKVGLSFAFYLLAVPCGLWGLGSLTRGWLNPGLRELKRRVPTAGLSENAPLLTFLAEEILETFPLWSGTKH